MDWQQQFSWRLLTGFWVIPHPKSTSRRGQGQLHYKSIEKVQYRTIKGSFTQLSKPTSLTCPSSSTSRFSSAAALTRLPARPSTQAAKGATGDSLKWHMLPKPLTWQRGSLSLWQWLGQSLHCRATQRALKNGRRGSTGMFLSLSLPFSRIPPSSLPQTMHTHLHPASFQWF